jgi:methionyl-tRNA synthetase
MLHAAGLPQPGTIFAHGWWVTGGAKMSKSLGNAVKPLDLVDIYGVDAFRYFLVRDMILGRDAEFGEENLARRYQSELANDLGNLLHRLTHMITRYQGGLMPEPGDSTADEESLQAEGIRLIERTFALVESMALNEALAEILAYVRAINGYLERAEPWKQARLGHSRRVAAILYTAAEGLRLAAVLLKPVMPGRAAEIWRRLGWQEAGPVPDGLAWGRLVPGSPVRGGEPLFPRDVIDARLTSLAAAV